MCVGGGGGCTHSRALRHSSCSSSCSSSHTRLAPERRPPDAHSTHLRDTPTSSSHTSVCTHRPPWFAGHDTNDYEIGKRFELEIINIMNDDGSLNDKAGPYAGLDRFAGAPGVGGQAGGRAVG